MFIEIQDTPNPNTLKFLLDSPILKDNKTFHFNTEAEASQSLLAKKLFEIGNISNIFLGYNFISVSIIDENQWDILKPRILGYINDFLNSGLDVVSQLNESLEQEKPVGSTEDEQDIINKISEIIEERVRPAVAMDGGDIIFKKYKDGVVYLSMQGSCSGCPSSTMTLKVGIENMLKYYVPQVLEVVSLEDN